MRSNHAAEPVDTPCGIAENRDGEDALTALSALLVGDLAACNRAVVACMNSEIELIPRLAAHIVAAGGKRLRPMLTLAAARLCDYRAVSGDMRHVKLAACIELIHTATLLHDDVVDESLLRRGRASANALFGNKPPVLVGDFLFARAFQLMVEDGSLRVLAILSGAAATIASGEVLQLVTQNDLATSDALYLDVVKGKTAALFAAACQIGAVVAGRADAEPALAEYGVNVGVAFQLVDDALDYAADETLLGKTVGDDFREGKVTLPVLIAYRRGGVEAKAFWERTIGSAEQRDGDLEHAIGLIQQADSISAALAYAGTFAGRARDALADFPDTLVCRRLRDVADYTVSRSR
jgi:octaprenyl-diphosphate synthase